MKTVLIHGSGQGPDMWLPWLKTELEMQGHEVQMPTLPDAEEMSFEKHLPYLLEDGLITPGCVLVGHSAGCRLILKALETINFQVSKAVLVAGSFRQLDFNYQKIKKNCEDVVFIVSDNDPWGCGEETARPYFNQLGGEMVIVKGGGHFGSNTYKSPLYEFPLLLKLVS